jgi:hypothetical protein
VAPPYDRERGFVPEFQPSGSISPWRLPLVVSNANLSMRRHLLERIGGYDELCGPGGLLRSSDDGDITLRMVRSGAKWKVCPQIAVVHAHGFRTHAAAKHLLDDYEYGNGAIYGRALRRGDLLSGGWFLVRQLVRATRHWLPSRHEDARDTRGALRMRGFWQGFRLPPQVGVISADDLRGREPPRERSVGEG